MIIRWCVLQPTTIQHNINKDRRPRFWKWTIWIHRQTRTNSNYSTWCQITIWTLTWTMWRKWSLRGLSSTRTMELAGMALALSQTKSTVFTIQSRLQPPLKKLMGLRSFSRWTVVVITLKLRIQVLWLMFYQESLFLHSCSCSSFRFRVRGLFSFFDILKLKSSLETLTNIRTWKVHQLFS